MSWMNFVALFCRFLLPISLSGAAVSVSAYSSKLYITDNIRQIGVQEPGRFLAKDLGSLLNFKMFSNISYWNVLGAKEQSLGKELLYLGLLQCNRYSFGKKESYAEKINHMSLLDNCLTSLLLLKNLPFLHPDQDCIFFYFPSLHL